MSALKNKVATVLGAAGDGNIGKVVARQLATEGTTVGVGGHGVERMAALTREIGGATYECDITKRDQLFAILDFPRKTDGHVDIGVNATG